MVKLEGYKLSKIGFTNGLATVVVAFVLVFFLSTPSYLWAGDEKVLLRFDPPAGKTLKYHASMRYQFDSGTMTMYMDYEMFFPDTVCDEGRLVTIKFIKFKGNMEYGDQMVDMDTGIMLEGREIDVVVSPNGKVVKIVPKGYIPGLMDPEGLKGLIGLGNFFPSLPDSEVSVGFSWRDEDVVKMEESGNSESVEYELKKIYEKKGFKLAEIQGKVMSEGVFTIKKATLEGRGKGKVKNKVILDGCYLAKCNSTLDLKGVVTGKDGGGEPKDFFITIYFECKLEK